MESQGKRYGNPESDQGRHALNLHLIDFDDLFEVDIDYNRHRDITSCHSDRIKAVLQGGATHTFTLAGIGVDP
jgi:hypothetical protein